MTDTKFEKWKAERFPGFFIDINQNRLKRLVEMTLRGEIPLFPETAHNLHGAFETLSKITRAAPFIETSKSPLLNTPQPSHLGIFSHSGDVGKGSKQEQATQPVKPKKS